MSHAEHVVEVSVDGDPIKVPRETTPNEIIGLVGLEPATHYLVLRLGRNEQRSFQGLGDERIVVHPHEAFITLSTGPTPTS